MSAKLKAGQYGGDRHAIIESRPFRDLFGFSLGTPAGSTINWEPGAIVVDITNGIIYRNSGSLTSSTWTEVLGVGGTAATLTVGTLIVSTSANIVTGVLTTATITTLIPTHIRPAQGASTAAAGNATGNAGALPAGTGVIYPVTAADDTKGVILHASDNITNNVLFIANLVSNKILKIYPPTGGTINGAAADAAYSTASGKGALIVCTDQTANTNTGAFAALG